MASAFRGVIEFFVDLGIYDVILPFFLVFTITFAILEKTRILGIEEIKGTEYPRNAMVAFVIRFLVVASSRLVAIINQSLSQIMILLLVSFSFLLAVGIFMKQGEFDWQSKDYKGWMTLFMVVMLIGVALIFLNAVGWLRGGYELALQHGGSTWFMSIIALVVVIVLVIFITRDSKRPDADSE